MHHFRMKLFTLIPCNKKDVSNVWCCYHFTDSSQQNLFIWSCSFSIGKRRSTRRSFLVKFFHILLRNRSVTYLGCFSNSFLELTFDTVILIVNFYLFYLFFSYSQMIQDMIVCGCHPLTQEVNQNWYAFQNYNCLMWYEWDDWENNLVPLYSFI